MTPHVRPLYVWILPVLILAGELLCEAIVPNEIKPDFFSEEGPQERLQSFIMLIAVVLAARLFFAVRGYWLKLWYGLAFFACLYIAGEEISWGQTYLQWATPESWGMINDQNETNLHNTSNWLDQKPKALLQIGVLVGGLIIPALQKWKPPALPARYAAIYPTNQVVVTAAFALFVKIIEKMQDVTDLKIFWRPSEFLETYIYYFVMLYLLIMWMKLKDQRNTTST